MKAEDMPQIKDIDGKIYYAVKGTKVTKIHNFAGKDTKSSLRVEEHLLKNGGKKGEWQHTTGDVKIDVDGKIKTAEVHWFQEPSVGIISAKIKRWRK